MPDWRNLQIYTVIIQNNPVIMVIYAMFKLESLKKHKADLSSCGRSFLLGSYWIPRRYPNKSLI
jgi:hypothetical protein